MIASPAQRPVPQRFEFVREWNDDFLQLFPHRGDYLWAEHPEPGKRPTWKTESRHLLSDRTIKQGAYLFGVRFGPTTNYLLFDIDIRSYYHPRQDPFAIWSMVEALEPLGLVSYVAVTSSNSGGLHLYFPFEEAQTSWALALAAKTLLQNKGFKFQGGQLEIFPNPKPFSEAQINYSGHRLPLQQGSYLLNQEWERIFTAQSTFVQQWQFAARKNSVSRQGVERVLQTAAPKHYSKKLKVSGQKYYSDLCNDLRDGFTGPGQTQPLFAKAANRERVFYHAIHGGSPLEGEALATRIAEVIRSLPGFDEFCGHQHEVEELAKSWARAAERRYYPYGSKKPILENQSDHQLLPKKPTWNQQQAQEARERIKQAIADLVEKNVLPPQTTARRNALRSYRIGNTTLDKNRDLWHPENLNPLLDEQYHPIKPDLENSDRPEFLPREEYHPIAPNKLLCPPASALQAQEAGQIDLLAVGGSGGLSTGDFSDGSQPTQELQPTESAGDPVVEPGPSLIREILSKLAANRQRAKSNPYSTQPPPDENYFRQTQQRQGDRPWVRDEFVQQSLELSEINPPPTSAPAVGEQGASVGSAMSGDSTTSSSPSVQALLSAIESEVERLGWIAAQEAIWVAQHFAGKRHSELSLRELVLLLRQLKQLHQNR
ncbi:hypothetical protein H6G00_15620 [Leptolyngbya sp. FACHB-541]|uniref:hypothetical protein n=1 Tax=Leptolyngbya sp. FACHB-541 TaxID=2692810 RepID=UPI001683E011|nr:hypothetical protein [Leptolyngbya sp. FACHB-541]MBD1998040.1 hypothetical protein [Leptolyngbya sp. FACHB-541]